MQFLKKPIAISNVSGTDFSASKNSHVKLNQTPTRLGRKNYKFDLGFQIIADE